MHLRSPPQVRVIILENMVHPDLQIYLSCFKYNTVYYSPLRVKVNHMKKLTNVRFILGTVCRAANMKDKWNLWPSNFNPLS